MAGRKFVFGTNEFYHVFNRGVARQPIFASEKDYAQALLTLTYYLFAKPPMKLSRYKKLSIPDRERLLAEQKKKSDVLVHLNSFVFMPNHVHFLLNQVAENGVSKFMSQFQNSYTRYFNTRHNRVGPLFQGIFKAVHIESEEQLLHLSRYIHLNPVVSSVVRKDELVNYPWSSFLDYLRGKSSFVTLESVLGLFKTPEKYKQFVFDHIDFDYAQRFQRIKHLLIDGES